MSLIDTTTENHAIDEAFGGRDELLTNLTIYWATQTIKTSIATYKQNAAAAKGSNGAICAEVRRPGQHRALSAQPAIPRE